MRVDVDVVGLGRESGIESVNPGMLNGCSNCSFSEPMVLSDFDLKSREYFTICMARSYNLVCLDICWAAVANIKAVMGLFQLIITRSNASEHSMKK